MKNAIEKVCSIAQKFKAHLKIEMLADPIIARSSEEIKSKIDACFPAKVFGGLYQSLQFGDFLISRIVEKGSVEDDYPATTRSAMDKFLAKTFEVPQYYGGIRQLFPSKTSLLVKLLGPVASLLGSGKIKDCIGDYMILEHIQNTSIPNVLLELFNYGNLGDIASLEAEESLKKLRNAILETKPEWTEKEIALDDIRQTEVESISIKNFKKTIRCIFEFSTLLKGKSDKKSMKRLKQNFSGVLEFVKEDGEWKASSFTSSEF